MTGYLTYDAHLARLRDMHARAANHRARRRFASPPDFQAARTPQIPADAIVIRRATDADLGAMRHLADLDSTRPPSGEVLLALVGCELVAAIEIPTGAVVADPFRPTTDLIELLRLRAARHRDANGRPDRPRLRRQVSRPAESS